METASTNRFSVFLSVLMIVFGIVGIVLPLEMSIGVVIVLSWLLIFSGVVQFVHVFRCRTIGNALWKALVAVAYLAAGFYLRLHPSIGLTALSFVLIVFFVTQGVVDIVTYFLARRWGASGWLLVDGLVTLALGAMIWRHWPSSGLWIVGLLVAVNMIMTGTTRLFLTTAARRSRAATPTPISSRPAA